MLIQQTLSDELDNRLVQGWNIFVTCGTASKCQILAGIFEGNMSKAQKTKESTNG